MYRILSNGDGKIPDSKDKVLDSYIEMLQGKKQIKEIFDILAKNRGGIIYYCNAGKDRTGVITAIILKFLGVNNKDIYSIINPNYDTMYNLLQYIDNQPNGIIGYLQSCNISNENLNKIKNKYIQKIK